MMKVTLKIAALLVLLAGMAFLIRSGSGDVQAQTAPRFKYDPDWPKPLPNKWKMGGVTGLAVDKDDNVWVLNRPNDLVSIEVHAEQEPPLADCCAHAPAMIHFDKAGNVIGSFDAPQGHGMAVDKQGFIYIGQNTVRKYDPKTGKMLAAIPHIPETANGQPFDDNPRIGWVKGQGTAGPLPDSSRSQTRARRTWRARRAVAAAEMEPRRRRSFSKQRSSPSIRRPRR